ncbi:MAG: hypothetical protein VKP62_04900 [Candidatus Sericytochromatia bacterium]|nr:hypothetical protein [Candidatus Sericytochromatia bacterium]
MSLLNKVVGRGAAMLSRRVEALGSSALQAGGRDAAHALGDRLALAAAKPAEALFPRRAVALAVGQQAAQDRLAPMLKEAGRTLTFAPTRYGLADLKAYQRNAHRFATIAKDFRGEFHTHTYLRDETRRLFGAHDPVAEQAQSLRNSLYWRMRDAARNLEQMPLIAPEWVRKAWKLVGFDVDAFDRKVVQQLGPKGLADIPGWVPRAWEQGPGASFGT